MKCKSCGNIPFEWVETKHGSINAMACEDCPNPDERAPDPIHAVLGAVLYDIDGACGHWARARDTLRAFTFGLFEDAAIAWMAAVAAHEAPSIDALMRHMGPERCTQVFQWHMRMWLRDAARADDFDAALVDVVRRQPARRAA